MTQGLHRLLAPDTGVLPDLPGACHERGAAHVRFVLVGAVLRCSCLTPPDLCRDAAFERMGQLMDALRAEGDFMCKYCFLDICGPAGACACWSRLRLTAQRRLLLLTFAAAQPAVVAVTSPTTCHSAGAHAIPKQPAVGAMTLDGFFGAEPLGAERSEPAGTERLVSPSPPARRRPKTGRLRSSLPSNTRAAAKAAAQQGAPAAAAVRGILRQQC